jgi:hypothetical protein
MPICPIWANPKFESAVTIASRSCDWLPRKYWHSGAAKASQVLLILHWTTGRREEIFAEISPSD